MEGEGRLFWEGRRDAEWEREIRERRGRARAQTHTEREGGWGERAGQTDRDSEARGAFASISWPDLVILGLTTMLFFFYNLCQTQLEDYCLFGALNMRHLYV